MLASPLLPSPTLFSSTRSPDDSSHYRPAKDLDSFNALLPPPVEFVEGSSSGTLAVAEGKYDAINASPKLSTADLPDPAESSTPAPKTPDAATSKTPRTKSLFAGTIDTSWPANFDRATGLYNTGNTCFLNSALQCLLHTPPLLRLLVSHSRQNCRVQSGTFCMTCSLRAVAIKAHGGNTSFSPSPISNNLQVIAKHLRKGRQEDTHEFLRYAIDALQKSCLAGHPPKLDAKISETTWVHKLFGGRLRSRVTCRECGYNSDTFDRVLDLSLDIFKCESLKHALQKFVAIDYLKGADKYKCEKCKKPVNAEKRFTIHEAPVVLTVHLKRFSPLGRKIGHPLDYPESLSLRPFMSEGQFGPSYSLYGVICHAGGGPNSGHYYAFVKSREGKWYEMNDESAQQTSLPLSKKSAYMLFYMQNRGQTLEASVKDAAKPAVAAGPSQQRPKLAALMKKRSAKDSDEEDKGVKVDAPSNRGFIGPVIPSHISLSNPTTPSKIVDRPDPQASALKAKIAAATSKASTSTAMASLGKYGSSDDEDNPSTGSGSGVRRSKSDDDMDVDANESQRTQLNDDDDNDSRPPPPSSPTSVPRASSPAGKVPTSSFYGSSSSQQNGKKRKSPDSESENRPSSSTPMSSRKSPAPGPFSSASRRTFHTPNKSQSSGFTRQGGGNPFNANALTYSKKKPRRAGI